MKTPFTRHSERSRLRDRLGEGEGQGQIEFVISIITIMFVIFWTWEVVLAVYTYNVISDAAKEGVRYAIVHGNNNAYCSGPPPAGKACPTPGVGSTAPTLCDGTPAASSDTAANNVITTVKCYAALSLHDISGITVTVTYPPPPGGTATNAPPNEVDVAIQYNYVPFLALPIRPLLVATSSGRIVN